MENVDSVLRFHVVFLFKYSCNFTYDNKIILNQKKTKVVNFATDITIQLTLIFLLIAIVIAPLIAPFVTGYVNTNYHPCGNNTGIFPGAIYIKNGMKCNNEYISRKEDSAVK